MRLARPGQGSAHPREVEAPAAYDRLMEPEELAELLRQPEGEQLEFKTGEVRPQVVARILGAFANTRGGT